MSDATLEKVISYIEQLSPEGLRQLRRLVDEKLKVLNQQPAKGSPPRIIGFSPSPKDRTKEYEWLEQHRDEYADQWVALDGNRLLAHGARLKEVAETARQTGVADALFIRVEPREALPYVGL